MRYYSLHITITRELGLGHNTFFLIIGAGLDLFPFLHSPVTSFHQHASSSRLARTSPLNPIRFQEKEASQKDKYTHNARSISRTRCHVVPLVIHEAAHVAHANDFTNTNSVVSFIPTLPIRYCTLSLVRGRPAGVWACGAERCCTGHSFRFPLTPRSCLFLYSVDFSTTSLVRRLALPGTLHPG